MTDHSSDVAILLLNRGLGVNSVIRRRGILAIQMETLRVIGCYISPNITIDNYSLFIEDIADVMPQRYKENDNKKGIKTRLQQIPRTSNTVV